MSQPLITYGFAEDPSPETTPFADVNPLSPSMYIGAWVFSRIGAAFEKPIPKQEATSRTQSVTAAQRCTIFPVVLPPFFTGGNKVASAIKTLFRGTAP